MSLQRNVGCWTLLVYLACLPAALPQPAGYDTNSVEASLDINGVQGIPNIPVILYLTGWACAGGTVPATGMLNFSSNAGAAGAFEIVVSAGPVAHAFGGGTAFPTGQILNISILQPMFFMNGVQLPRFDALPLAPVSATFSSGSPLDVTIQGIVANPVTPGGFDMTQPTELHIAISPPQATVTGPTDNTVVTIDVTAAPHCWTPAGIPFYGTTYTQMHVSDNGRVTFFAPNSSWSPSLPVAVGGPPCVGVWADFNPALGGFVSIGVTSLGYVRVDYQNVIYGNLGGTSNTFYIEFDWLTGSIEIGGLGGFIPHPNGASQFLGISPGGIGSGTDPGAVNFSPAVSPGGGIAASPNDMIYDFGPSPLASFSSGVNQIFFIPQGTNYAWASM